MPTPNIRIREYHPDDAEALARIFYDTFHKINIRDYTREQVEAVAPKDRLAPGPWARKFAQTEPLVAVVDGQIVGFAEFEPDGHIDCFYCHHEWIRRGVGTALMHVIHDKAHKLGIQRIFARVSITAKPFFEKHGFSTLNEVTVIRNGIEILSFNMEKIL